MPNELNQQTESQRLWHIIGTVRDSATNRTIQGSDADLQVVLHPISKVKESGKFDIPLVSTTPFGQEILDYDLQIEDKTNHYHTSDPIRLEDFREQFKNTRIIDLPDSYLKLIKKTSGSEDSVVASTIKEFN